MWVFKAEKYIGKGTVGIFQRDFPQNREEEHSHDFIEVVYVLSGSAVQWVDGESYEVSRGDMIFINYGACHAFQPREDFRYINICFLPEVLCGKLVEGENALAMLSLTAFEELRREKNGGKLSFSGEARGEVEFILGSMLREYRQQLPACEQVLESYLSILFSKMLRKTLAGEDSAQIRDVWQTMREYIDENLGQELTLSALAQKSFYNPSYFSRMFKQKFGMSLSRYLREKRIDQAMLLLADTDQRVESIMEQIGYSDRSAFYHAFAKRVGMTPTEYREKVKNNHTAVK